MLWINVYDSVFHFLLIYKNLQEPIGRINPQENQSGSGLLSLEDNKTSLSLSSCCTVQTLVMLSGLLIVTSLKHTCAPIRLFNQRHLSGEDEAH